MPKNIGTHRVRNPYIKNFYFQNIILDPFGNHVFKTNINGNVKVTYTPLSDDRGISISTCSSGIPSEIKYLL